VPSEQQRRLAFWLPRGWALRILLACIALVAISIQLIPPNDHWTSVVISGSRGRPVLLGSRPKLCGALHQPNGVLQISGRVDANTLSNFPNIFETATPERGVRMEVAPSGTVGGVFFSRKAGIVGMGPTVLVRARQSWSFSLDIKKGGFVSLEVNNNSAAQVLTNLVLTCNELLVGGGFNASRALHGVADPVEFKSGTETPRIPAVPEIAAAGFILLLWVLTGSIAGPSRGGQHAGKPDD
jgi:hypothetical protein